MARKSPSICIRPWSRGAIDPTVAGFRLQRGDGIYIPNISEQVTVTGAVAKPGPYSLTDDLTVVSLLARAGNEAPNASLRRAYVIRKGITIPLDLTIFLSGDTSQPSLTGFRLQPGDTLVVPENKIFYAVLGQVNNPGTFAYPENPNEATVLNALFKAGGPSSTVGDNGANLKEARIVCASSMEKSRLIPSICARCLAIRAIKRARHRKTSRCSPAICSIFRPKVAHLR